MTVQLEQLHTHTWPSDGVYLAGLGIRLDALAGRLGLIAQSWWEDGLGPARGVAVRLPTGRVVALVELEHAVRDRAAQGPTLFMDATDVLARGFELLLSEATEGLGLKHSDLATVNNAEDVYQFAMKLTADIAAARAKRESRE